MNIGSATMKLSIAMESDEINPDPVHAGSEDRVGAADAADGQRPGQRNAPKAISASITRRT